ncbi:MAG: two-component sensor histidine kinase [Acidimicrobiales bacterium]|nr:two-component sensor histidine kinase [Acidimicrobiales bacterium]
MDAFAEVMRWLDALVFSVLSIASYRGWRRRGGEAGGWLFATFGNLALLSWIGVAFHPGHVVSEPGVTIVKVILIGLALYPWTLYRFTGAFGPKDRRVERLVNGLTVLVIAAAVPLPRFPAQGEPVPGWLLVYVWVFLIQWTVLSLIVARRLWGAGRGQPTVARRRMRMLSLGSIALTIAALPGASPSVSATTGVTIVTKSLPLLAAVFFFIGFSPPAFLRMLWRRPEQDALRRAEVELMRTLTAEETGKALLPHVLQILGGRAGLFADRAGTVLAAMGFAPDESDEVRAVLPTLTRDWEVVEPRPGLLVVPVTAGWLAVQAGPYTPFFGEEEMGLLSGLGLFTQLALQRAELFERERDSREAIESANAELETLVYGVSHDLKSPIITLLGYLEYLRADHADALPEEGRHYLDRMDASARYMQQLITDLLELSRVGRVQTDADDVDLGPLVDDVAVGVISSHPEMTIAVGAMPVVRMNTVRARQLFTNLLENSAVHAGRADVHVRVAADRQAEGAVTITVSDDGVGIAAAYRDRVFGIFERLGGADQAGTGMGLAMARKIVEQVDGAIAAVEPLHGLGTELRIEFPARAVRRGPTNRQVEVSQ